MCSFISWNDLSPQEKLQASIPLTVKSIDSNKIIRLFKKYISVGAQKINGLSILKARISLLGKIYQETPLNHDFLLPRRALLAYYKEVLEETIQFHNQYHPFKPNKTCSKFKSCLRVNFYPLEFLHLYDPLKRDLKVLNALHSRWIYSRTSELFLDWITCKNTYDSTYLEFLNLSHSRLYDRNTAFINHASIYFYTFSKDKLHLLYVPPEEDADSLKRLANSFLIHKKEIDRHSSILHSLFAESAGYVQFNFYGQINYIDNLSGHYAPSVKQLVACIDQLRECYGKNFFADESYFKFFQFGENKEYYSIESLFCGCIPEPNFRAVIPLRDARTYLSKKIADEISLRSLGFFISNNRVFSCPGKPLGDSLNFYFLNGGQLDLPLSDLFNQMRQSIVRYFAEVHHLAHTIEELDHEIDLIHQKMYDVILLERSSSSLWSDDSSSDTLFPLKKEITKDGEEADDSLELLLETKESYVHKLNELTKKIDDLKPDKLLDVNVGREYWINLLRMEMAEISAKLFLKKAIREKRADQNTYALPAGFFKEPSS